MSHWIDSHLKQAFLQMRVPVVLNFVVCPARQMCSYCRPLVSKNCMELENGLLLIKRKLSPLYIRPQIVGPSKPATFATPEQPCILGEGTPTPMTMLLYVVHKLLIFLRCPRAFFQSVLVATRSPAHIVQSLAGVLLIPVVRQIPPDQCKTKIMDSTSYRMFGLQSIYGNKEDQMQNARTFRTSNSNLQNRLRNHNDK